MAFNPSKTIDPTITPSVRRRGLDIVISHGTWGHTFRARDEAHAKRFMSAMAIPEVRRAAFYVGVAPLDAGERQRRKGALVEACMAHGVSLMTPATRELYDRLRAEQSR